MNWQQGKARMLGQLADKICTNFAEGEAAALIAFSERLYNRATAEESSRKQLSDLYGATIGTWNFLQHLSVGQTKVRVFNPAYMHHGWQLEHTVVTALSRNMPFMTDSIRGELNRRNLAIHSIQTTILNVIRDEEGNLVELLGSEAATTVPPECTVSEEVILYFEIGRHSDDDALKEIQSTLYDILAEVSQVVDDFTGMTAVADQVWQDIGATEQQDPERRDEIVAFVQWLRSGHFTFLGYEKLAVCYEGTRPVVTTVEGSTLGLLKLRESQGCFDLTYEISSVRDPQQLLDSQVTFSKSYSRSRIHRLVYPDYVCCKIFDAEGQVVGEHRLLGMYTSSVYTLSPTLIPLVRGKVAEVLVRSGLDVASHEGKDLAHVLEVFPRDELIQSHIDELFATTMAVNQIQERRQVRLFVRRGHYGKFINCLMYTPREVYHTQLREKVETILCDAFGASESDFTTYFSESILIRTHFVLRVDHEKETMVDEALLEEEIIKVTMSWQDHLRNHLCEEFGEERGATIAENYGNAFTPGYMDDFEPRAAVDDINKFDELTLDNNIAMSFYRRFNDSENHLNFRLYHRDTAVALSDVMPLLENLGLRVLGENPYRVSPVSGATVWVHEFRLEYAQSDHVDIKAVAAVFEDAFPRIWYGDAESDSFNRLIIGASMGWRRIAMLRAYARYMKQIQFNFSGDYIAGTLSNHTEVAKSLVNLFVIRFDPSLKLDKESRAEKFNAVEKEMFEALESVGNLSEDRIIRHYIALIKATLRTNYFQRDDNGELKNYFSLKLSARDIPEMPLPKPMFEIFVYSPRVEGVHLRGGKVARGGLRWSDRQEDFRTEVLGLVKAQQVKNAVIVPTGAKGGFVAKRAPVNGGREAMLEEGVNCYKIFIKALLDITDNLQEGVIVPPKDVVRADDDDSYLVVAADKGTATFSDIANDISMGYGFWMGDAFASGGSVGYDHKKMGITARGAWVSVQRHFRELGINTQTTDFTVVAVGDMGGDVFGNGMLCSEHIQLTAAFNHLHIFIDPNPDSAASFVERQRLFKMPRSSWTDYSSELISEGGGIFNRSAKSIKISPQMKARFDISADKLTPAELLNALLKAPIDLLWNGGIGTYIKASTESHAEAGDKANDVLRVDAKDVRFKVIGEGGNLGVTQLARVEYALLGGRVNTDFIDNAGGVDCSDREVNIKILLNEVITSGEMTEKQRNVLLEEMTDSVSQLVLENNYRQTGAISLAEVEAVKRNSEYRRVIQAMEAEGRLNRELEFLPADDVMVERKGMGKGLTRPELSVLISYAKSQLKEELVDTSVPDNDYMAKAVETAFPNKLRQDFNKHIHDHRLRREIIATQIGNDMVNHMGITYVDRISHSTGADIGIIAQAYVVARDVFNMPYYWRQIEALDYDVSSDTQASLMLGLVHLIRRSSRWFIRNRRASLDPMVEIKGFKNAISQLEKELPDMILGKALDTWKHRTKKFTKNGVPDELALFIASTAEMYPLLGIIEAAKEMDIDVIKVGKVFFTLAHKLEIDWFSREIAELKVENHWQALARESFRDDLEWQMRALTLAALRHMQPEQEAEECVDSWLESKSGLIGRWRTVLTELQGTETLDFAMYSVAIRELLDMAQRSKYDDVE